MKCIFEEILFYSHLEYDHFRLSSIGEEGKNARGRKPKHSKTKPF